MNISFKKILLWLLVIIWLVIIFLFSGMDSESSNNKSEKTINKVVETTLETTNSLGITNKHPSNTKLNNFVMKINIPLRKCMHAFVYFVLSLIVLNALSAVNIKSYKSYVICIVICFLYAIFDEYHQTFIDGRTGQITDSLIDTFGSIIGIILYHLYKKNIKFLKKRQNMT